LKKIKFSEKRKKILLEIEQLDRDLDRIFHPYKYAGLSHR